MTTAEVPSIQKTPGVCGGAACVRSTRIPVWLLVLARKTGRAEAELVDDYPGLTRNDLEACWNYYREHPLEIEQAIWLNDTAANVAPGGDVPSWVLVAGRLVDLSDEQIREAFDPPLTDSDLQKAWEDSSSVRNHRRTEPRERPGCDSWSK